MTKAPARSRPRPRRSTTAQAGSIDPALQGGGSHGAFTWGVLDALLEDGRLAPDGVSGTSAGAMNAAVLATGWAQGGRDGARQALHDFWHAVGGSAGCWGGAHLPGTALPAWAFNRDQWPGMALFNSWLQLWSPYQLNPLNVDPLRSLIEAHVRIDAIRQGPLKVFITATSVRTGQPRVFDQHEVSIEALLASACLPQIAQTVEIDGEPYWDGGFSGNPALWPLIYGTQTDDVLLVQINPRVREGIPRTATDIADRVNEITFNASLVAEMRAIAFVQKLLKEERVDPSRYKSLRLHRMPMRRAWPLLMRPASSTPTCGSYGNCLAWAAKLPPPGSPAMGATWASAAAWTWPRSTSTQSLEQLLPGAAVGRHPEPLLLGLDGLAAGRAQHAVDLTNGMALGRQQGL